MAGLDDEVGEDFVEGVDGGCERRGRGGRAGVVAEGVEEVAEVGGVEDLPFGARTGARFRHLRLLWRRFATVLPPEEW